MELTRATTSRLTPQELLAGRRPITHAEGVPALHLVTSIPDMWKALKFDLSRNGRASYYAWARRYTNWLEFRVYVQYDLDADGIMGYRWYRRRYYNDGRLWGRVYQTTED